MKKNTSRRRTTYLIAAVLITLTLLWLLWLIKFADNFPNPITLQAPQNFWGLTYSKNFASHLNLDWQRTYLDILDDLGAKNIRLPLYWQDIEAQKGAYDFRDYDWLLNQGAKRQAKFIVVLGHRQPRWPECHQPDWADNLNVAERKAKIKNLITASVNRYKNRPEIVAWQVENEPLLDSFGICPKGDPEWLSEEIALVRELDKRPIIITASGELSSWRREAQQADVLGTTLYRVVWGPLTGYVRWPLPTWFYKWKLRSTKQSFDQAIIAELQAEPWAPNTSLDKLPTAKADKSFDLQQFRANLQYAINTNFKQAYLWGVEWWYLEKTRGNDQFWEEAKKLEW